MNRHQRRAAKALGEDPKALADRAQREGYVLFKPSADHAKKLGDLQARIFAGLDDVSCFDCLSMFLTLASVMAVYGAENTVDQFPRCNRETFLKNCAERYDTLTRSKAEHDRKRAELQ